MRVTGHVAVGASSYLYAATIYGGHPIYQNGVVFWFSGLLLTIFGSLLPDVDHPGSAFGSKVRFISYPLSLVFGHRGITHSIWALIGMCWLGWYFLTEYINVAFLFVPCLALGYLSHLFADALTPQGIVPFWPMKKRFRFPIVQNGVMEVITYVLIMSSAIWTYQNFGPGF